MNFVKPIIERDVPIPLGLHKKLSKKRRECKASPWLDFLRKLQPGDSFKVEFPQSWTVMLHAKSVDVKLIRAPLQEYGERFRLCRLWVIKSGFEQGDGI